MNIEQFFRHLSEKMANDDLYADLIDDDMRAALEDAQGKLDEGIEMVKSDKYSRMIVQTTLPQESEETTAFIEKLNEVCDSEFQGEYYLIGNSAMNYEMSKTFDDELLTITLLTSIAIFVIVAISFRSLIIPALLVLLVQCGIYITVTLLGVQGISIYYLALLMVECILMGATIDYGILFTNYYRESRETLDVKESIGASYKGSIHTILTSGLIMVLVTGLISFLYDEPTIAQICRTLSIGVLSAMALIVFILPGMLATFDKWVVKRNR